MPKQIYSFSLTRLLSKSTENIVTLFHCVDIITSIINYFTLKEQKHKKCWFIKELFMNVQVKNKTICPTIKKV